MSPPRVSLLLFATLLLALGAPAAAGSPPLRGIRLQAGDQASSAIEPAGDLDTYVLDAFGGASLSVSISGDKKSGLVPTLEVLDPSGDALELDPYASAKKNRVSLKKLPLRETGRYAIVVGSADGSVGAYLLKTRAAIPKKTKLTGLELLPDETIDVLVPGVTDVVAKVKIQDRGGGGFAVLAVLDPEGREVPGAVGSIIDGKGTLTLVGPHGDYVIRLGGAVVATTLDVTVKAKYPKPRKKKHDISPVEPAVTELDPDSGKPGDWIDISGGGFSSGTVEVLFGTRPSDSVVVKSATLVRAEVPDAFGGAVPVTVCNPDGQSDVSPGLFTILTEPPPITAVSPPGGPDTGGTVVDVYGEALGGIVEVKLGGATVASGPDVIDDGHLRFTTDPHDPGMAALELVDGAGPVRTLNSAFTFYGAPVVESVQPPGGTVHGGTTVSVSGMWLHPDDRLYLDGIEMTSLDHHGWAEIRADTPAHAAGKVDLRIEDPWGRSATLVDAYEFVNSSLDDGTEDWMPANTLHMLFAGKTIAVGDLDGDKKPDIVLGRRAGPGAGARTITLMHDGKVGFKGRNLPTPPGDGDDWVADSVALGDLDGDGDLDLVLTCTDKFESTNTVSYFVGKVPHVLHALPLCSTRVLLNDGVGGFVQKKDAFPDPRMAGTDVLQANSVAVGDVDGDSDLDLVLTLHKGVGESSYTVKVLASFVHRYFSVVRKDDRSSTRVLLNDGLGAFTDATDGSVPGLADGDMFAGDEVVLGDVDGDDDLDIVLTGNGSELRDKAGAEYVSGSKTRVLLNDGDAAFENETATFVPTPVDGDDWGGVGLALGDIDGDGVDDDLVLIVDQALRSTSGARDFLPSTRVFIGAAKGFEDATSTWVPAVRADGKGDLWLGVEVAIADPDAEGHPDVFLVHTEEILVEDPGSGSFDRKISSLRWLANSGTAPLADVTEIGLPDPEDREDYLLGHAIALGDVDGDQDLDLILTTELGQYLDVGERPTRVLETR